MNEIIHESLDVSPPDFSDATDESIPSSSDEKIEIRLGVDEHLVTEAAIQALARDPSVFQRLGQLVQIVHDPRPMHAPRIAALPAALVRECLTRQARFMAFDPKTEEWRPAHPPHYTVLAIHQRSSWNHVRPLEGVIETPAMRPDGSIIQTPGYDDATGLFFAPSFEFLPVPEAPTLEDAKEARDLLMESVSDFPFTSPAHYAAYAAALLTPFARPAFDGPAPLTLIEANVPGSGKGLLVDVISILFTGRPIARTPYSTHEEEMRKVITSVALAGDSITLFDNIVGNFGSPALDAVMTGALWKDRTLGTNERISCELKTQFFATGNNVALAGDMLRRLLHVRLESKLEHPEERADFAHPDLLAWARSQRPMLVRAALTVLRAYHLAGRPKMPIPSWGSFESWDRLIRHAIYWAGMEDPNAQKRELLASADTSMSEIRLLMAMLEELDPKHEGISAVDIAARYSGAPGSYPATVAAIQTLGLEGKGARNIGCRLRRHKSRVVGGKRIGSPVSTRDGICLWAVQEA